MGVLEAEVGRERAGGGGVESDMCIKPGRGTAMQYKIELRIRTVCNKAVES